MKKKTFIPSALLVFSLSFLTGCVNNGQSTNSAEADVLNAGEEDATANMSVTITGTNKIEVGGQAILSLSLENATGAFVWDSSNKAVATVGSDNGLVTGLSVGTTTITATSMADYTVKAEYDIEVVKDLDNQYSVEFYNYDGTLLYETYVGEGETAVYQGKTPTRLNSYDTIYNFLRWDQDLTAVTSNIQTYAIYSESDFGDYFFEKIGTTYKLVGYAGKDETVVTPTSFNNLPVTAIGSYIVQGNTTLKNLVVSEGVDTIDTYAFAQATALQTVSLPGSVYSLSTWLFYQCSSLTSVSFGEGVAEIPDYMFNQCTALTNITLPDTVTTLGSMSFFMSGLTSITLGENVTKLGSSCFASCSSLTSATFLAPVMEIDTGTFSSCTNLTSFTWDGYTSDKTFPIMFFSGCSSMTTFVMNDEFTGIDRQAFYGTSSLTHFEVSKNLAKIGDRAFTNSAILTQNEETGAYDNFIIKDGDTNCKIEDGILFTNGYKRAAMLLDGGDASIDSDGKFDVEKYGITEIGDFLFDSNTAIKSIDLTNITYYGESCFDTARNLDIGDLVLSSKVTYVGTYAFYGGTSTCPNVTSITIDTDFGGTKTIVERAFQGCYKNTSITITGDIETIETWAFGNNATRTSPVSFVYIPKTVKNIGYRAFFTSSYKYNNIKFEGTADEWNAIDFNNGDPWYNYSVNDVEFNYSLTTAE